MWKFSNDLTENKRIFRLLFLFALQNWFWNLLRKRIEEVNVRKASKIAKISYNLIINLWNTKSGVLFDFLEHAVSCLLDKLTGFLEICNSFHSRLKGFYVLSQKTNLLILGRISKDFSSILPTSPKLLNQQ